MRDYIGELSIGKENPLGSTFIVPLANAFLNELNELIDVNIDINKAKHIRAGDYDIIFNSKNIILRKILEEFGHRGRHGQEILIPFEDPDFNVQYVYEIIK
jgi:hypothetical protein